MAHRLLSAGQGAFLLVVAIPLVFVSIMGFIKLLGFRFFAARTQFLFWSMSLSNVAALLLFTQIWPQYGILTLIAGAAISLAVLYVYGRVKVMPFARISRWFRASMNRVSGTTWPAPR